MEELIYSYTRKRAIEDGVLVDLSQFEVIRQHWEPHVACTATVFAIIEEAIKHQGKDVQGILHDISVRAKLAIRGADGDTVHFEVIVGKRKVAMKLHCGPGDEPVPVLTLMLPNED